MKRLVMRLLVTASLVASSLAGANTAHAVSTTIVINEVDCHGNDWIEIGNRSTRTIDISGWLLSDKALNSTAVGHVYTFPAGTRIAAKGRLVVQQSGTGNLHLGFGVNCAVGATVKIGYRNGSTYPEVDSVQVPVITTQTSYGRLPDLTGGFGLTTPTKNLANYGVKPILTSSTTKNCIRGRACTMTLSARNAPTYRLTTAMTGVTISSSGVLTVNSSRVATFRPSVVMTNSFGTTTVTITVNVKAG
ncbi:MAG: hypothetical protein RLZZ587_516 [Actinomycetota bacterium]